MSPVLALLFLAKDAGLSWEFDGHTTKAAGRYELVGKGFRGEVYWFATPKGRFDAESLYNGDTGRTKEADRTKAFTHERLPLVFAGMPAILSEQRYRWDDALVTSRCVYCAQGSRAWVVRLWWPRASVAGDAAAWALLKSFKRL